ncbi:MAG: prepilin-type N-terminal cleavage/methylation domain-containing protein [Polyangiaceae bacterium]
MSASKVRKFVERARRKLARGYTMVEVMMALGVLAVGATGVVLMQKVVIVGNASARSIASGSALAERWMERLRADAMVWNTMSPSDLGETRWLKTVATDPDAWTLPAKVVGSVSYEADALGAEIIDPADTSAVGYCTHIRYRQITPKMINVIVRVTWRRDFSPIDCTTPAFFDENADPASLGYGAAYLTTGVLIQEKP